MDTAGSFPWGAGESDLDVKPTINLHLVQRLRMRGAIHPLPHTSS